MEERSANLMTANILSNPDLVDNLKKDPATVLQQQAVIATAASPLQSDRVIYRIVVGCLGGTIILVTLGLTLLATGTGWKIPDGLVAIGSAAVGALAGLLSPTPITRA